MSPLKRIWYLIPSLNIKKPPSNGNIIYSSSRFTNNEANQKFNVGKGDKIVESLKTKFPLAKEIKVVDISGGCGQMYEIIIETIEFEGLSVLKQHKLVNEILKEDIKQMHGLRILTKIPNNKE